MSTSLESKYQDNWSQYEKKGLLFINYGHPNSTYSFPDGTMKTLPDTVTEVRVYAEKIEISKSVTYPGINVMLCCNKLSVKRPQDSGMITLDVSGKGGKNGPAESGGNTKQLGEDGKNSGSITLYVEDLDMNIMHSLRLKANGGRGGAGSADTRDGQRGANGGKGGNGGDITIYFGIRVAQAIPFLRTILKDKTKSFSARLFILKDSLVPLLSDIKASGVALDVDLERLNDKISQYVKLLGSIAGLAVALNARVKENQEEPIWKMLANDNSSLMSSLAEFVKSTGFPNNPKNLLVETQNLAEKVDAGGIAKNPEEAAEGLRVSYQAYEKLLLGETGEFEDYIDENVREVVQGCILKLSSSLQSIATVEKGYGGEGGLGDPNETNNGRGDRGVDGTQGTKTIVRPLFGHAHPHGTKATTVLANPDQCQMVLNFADLQYFKGSTEQRSLATSLYTTLRRRLDFVPELLADQTGKTPLGVAYKKLEDDGIIVATRTQLSQLYETARGRLHQLELGQDFLTQSPTWAPRLSYNYYQTRIKSLCKTLDRWESIYTDYQKYLTDSTKMQTIIGPALENASKGVKVAEDQIETLEHPAGEMVATGFTIQRFTPLMKAKKRDIADKMKPLTERVKLNIKIEPSTFLNALGAVIKDHKTPDLWKQGLGLLGSFESVYEKAKIEKDNIIKQLKEVEGTFESMKEGFTALSDGRIDIDDPGAGKLLIAKANFDKLLKQFKEALPEEDANAVSKEVDAYVTLVETRNNAVIRYNLLVQKLFQAYKDKDFYEAQRNEYSRKLADSSVDPKLPSTTLWLRKSRDDMRQRVLQVLYEGSRALTFWGLIKKDPMSFFSDIRDELPTSAKLLEAQETLANTFDEVLKDFAGTIRTSWPSDKRNPKSKQMGVVVRLSESQLAHFLRHPRVGDAGKKIHEVVLNIAPALNSEDSENPFNGRANVRIDQVRVWLPGAKVGKDSGGRNTLTISLTQYGNETIISTGGTPFTFTHDRIKLDFSYFADKVTSIEDIGNDKVFGRQDILENMYHGVGKVTADTYAPVGSFATWLVEVSEARNAGLDLDAVKEVLVEFWGSSMPFR